MSNFFFFFLECKQDSEREKAEIRNWWGYRSKIEDPHTRRGWGGAPDRLLGASRQGRYPSITTSCILLFLHIQTAKIFALFSSLLINRFVIKLGFSDKIAKAHKK